MILLLAPSKTMRTDRMPPAGVSATIPPFQPDAERIAASVMQYPDMAKLMHVSQPLANEVVRLYKDWRNATAPAIYAYAGDVYRWFFAETLSSDDLKWMQGRFFIVSGLYGLVRPTDVVSPYRLEMKAKVSVGSTETLYAFWADRLANYIDQASDDPIICNLSSDEYARVVTRGTKKRVVTPTFVDKKKDGSIGTVPIYSKMMRGVLARWIIDHRVDAPEGLQAFALQGYVYDPVKSTADMPVFYRDNPRPIRVE